MQELMLLSFSFSQSLGSRIRRYRGDPNAGNFSGRGKHRALGHTYLLIYLFIKQTSTQSCMTFTTEFLYTIGVSQHIIKTRSLT